MDKCVVALLYSSPPHFATFPSSVAVQDSSRRMKAVVEARMGLQLFTVSDNFQTGFKSFWGAQKSLEKDQEKEKQVVEKKSLPKKEDKWF